MRSFGNDAPQFFNFKLEGSDEVYAIPLASCLSNREIVMMQDAGNDYRKQVDWLRLYMRKAVDGLTPKTTADILKAWAQASEDNGAAPGES